MSSTETTPEGFVADTDPMDSAAAILRDAVIAGETRDQYDGGEILGVTVPAGAEFRVVDLEQLGDQPRRHRGEVALHTVDSFCGFVGRHAAQKDTVVYANVEQRSIVAVLNDDQAAGAGGDPGWRDHRAKLQLRHTPEWKAWTAFAGKLHGQVAFAEHLENNRGDIVDPPAAVAITIARQFRAKQRVEFVSDITMESGDHKFLWEQTTDAKASPRGDIEVPATFMFRAAVFEGEEPIDVTARFVYRINEGHLQLGLVIEQLDRIVADAFAEIRGRVAERLEHSAEIFDGTPPTSRAA